MGRRNAPLPEYRQESRAKQTGTRRPRCLPPEPPSDDAAILLPTDEWSLSKQPINRVHLNKIPTSTKTGERRNDGLAKLCD